MPAGSALSSSIAKSESRKYLKKPAIDSFVLSFEEQSLRNKTKRHHWMICSSRNPDMLISWGHAVTHEAAEYEANKELEELVSGCTQGGRVASIAPPNHHMFLAR